MQLCRACARHFRCGEACCPFCAAAAAENACAASLSRRMAHGGALMLGAIAVAGCQMAYEPTPTQPAYGVAVPSARPSVSPSPESSPSPAPSSPVERLP